MASFLLEAPSRRAVQTRLLIVLDARLGKSHPGDQAEDADVAFVGAAEGVDGPAADEEEVRPRAGHLADAYHVPHDEVVQADEENGANLVVPAATAHSPDHLRSFAPLGQQVGNSLGGVLQIGGEDHGAVAPRPVQSADHGHVRSEIAREAHAAYARVAPGEFLNGAEGIVSGMIVHDDPFPMYLQAIKHASQALIQRGQVLLFAVGRRHDTEQRSLIGPGCGAVWHHGKAPPLCSAPS